MSFIRFDEFAAPVGLVTRRWLVRPIDGSDAIGEIRWYARWRCYAFFPESECVFERKCLRDIADFCERRTAEHRARRKVGAPV